MIGHPNTNLAFWDRQLRWALNREPTRVFTYEEIRAMTGLWPRDVDRAAARIGAIPCALVGYRLKAGDRA